MYFSNKECEGFGFIITGAYYTHLGVPVDVCFEVLVLADDCLGDDVIVVDAHSWSESRSATLCQPCDLLGLLVVLKINDNHMQQNFSNYYMTIFSL